jgi:6-pyruvoyltetrahydropterin/6-carboxytetrahydropterin synthase
MGQNLMYEVTIKKTFSAAHILKEIGGRCEELHGHNFMVEVSVSAPELNKEGLLIDFRVLKKWTHDILEALDHKYLNEVDYFKDINPSSEHVARLIYDRIAEKAIPERYVVSRVTVWESENARVSYRR